MDKIPYHITNQVVKRKLEDVHKCAKGERGIYRGCDGRLAVIQLSIQFEQEREQCEELFFASPSLCGTVPALHTVLRLSIRHVPY